MNGQGQGPGRHVGLMICERLVNSYACAGCPADVGCWLMRLMEL
jgi:hypothetical protein